MKENTPPPVEEAARPTPGTDTQVNDSAAKEAAEEPPMYGSAAPLSSGPSTPPFLSAVHSDFWDFLEN